MERHVTYRHEKPGVKSQDSPNLMHWAKLPCYDVYRSAIRLMRVNTLQLYHCI